MAKIKHPYFNEMIEGNIINFFEELNSTDCFPSSSGKWQRNPISDGILLRDCGELWVRPD